MSKTMEAIKWLKANPDQTQKAAATKFGLTGTGGISASLKKEREKKAKQPKKRPTAKAKQSEGPVLLYQAPNDAGGGEATVIVIKTRDLRKTLAELL